MYSYNSVPMNTPVGFKLPHSILGVNPIIINTSIQLDFWVGSKFLKQTERNLIQRLGYPYFCHILQTEMDINCGRLSAIQLLNQDMSYLTIFHFPTTRGEEGALPRDCHSLSSPWLWSELCHNSITNCWWTIPFNQAKWRWNNDEVIF
jgi:hypothetical protein